MHMLCSVEIDSLDKLRSQYVMLALNLLDQASLQLKIATHLTDASMDDLHESILNDDLDPYGDQ